jgi:hypothetical protein
VSLDLALDRALDRALDSNLDLDVDLDRIRALDSGLARDVDRARGLARDLAAIASALHRGRRGRDAPADPVRRPPTLPGGAAALRGPWPRRRKASS